MPNSEHIIGLPYFQILKTVRQMPYLEISVKYTGSLNCARLRKYLKSISGLEAVYDFKQNFMKLILLKTLKKVACKKYVPIFLQKINQLRSSNFPSLQAPGEALNNKDVEI